LQVVTHEEMMVTKDIDSFLSGEEASNTIGGLLHFPQRPPAHTLFCRDEIRKMASEVIQSTRTIAGDGREESDRPGTDPSNQRGGAESSQSAGPAAPPSRSSRVPIDPATEQFLSALNVLVVDDSAINRKVLSSVLRKVGCRDIDEASDGVEALQAVQVGHYDLVFMDNTMPNMNGIDCVKALREQLQFPNMIIGVTGNTMREELRDFLLSGLDAVQTKPFSMQALLAFVPCLVARGVRSAPGRKLRIKRMGDDLSAVTVEEVDAEEYFSAVQ